MEQLSGNKSHCGFSLGRPRFGSTQENQAEDDEKQAKNIGLMEEEDDDGTKSEELEVDVEEEALGGHKRLHQTRKYSMMRPKRVSCVVGRYDERGEYKVDCCVCHKTFQSMKALYGHMRFHPDRGWKGVLPPRGPHHPLGNLSSSTISTDNDNDDDDDNDHWELGNVVDLEESIKGWWRTGKRGRRSALKDNIDAENLLFLATTAESVDLDVAETSHSGEEMTKKSKKRRKKKKRLSEMENELSTSHQQLEVVLVGGADEEGGGGAREKHVCGTCNKSFTSYQALGGHRASHNKVKILENNQARANGEVSLLGAEAMAASAQRPNTSLGSNGDHVCNKCHRSFPTGQALGGHKRRHWTGLVSSEAAIAVPTAPAAASSSQVAETVQEVRKLKRTPLEFDLNELPPNEESSL
ncbi:unnamed protein product [Eruca vesicaria subsp. sativa]|uniref:C2H2-type domain-containing protein n=1 Tax=Eruca vesicaria subsp. sativa TaxID=29727 RepID=A0ABC8LLH5_ERUVS|nr:unnamed protein product [Eruca vesicaria subsp. sativa]